VARRQRLRRDESQAQTREALLSAASRLFDDQGFAATSITDIAEEAGYTTGAVYSNFANKDDLFLAVIERQVVGEITALSEELSAETQPGKRLEIVGRWYTSQAGKGRQRIRAFAELALLGSSHDSLDRVREQRKLLQDALAELLRRQETELGMTFHVPVPTLAAAVLAVLEGFAIGSVIDDEIDDDALMASLEMLLR
jgi:AcrR family transcriptional regulator